MTLTAVAKASAIYMWAAVLYAGGHVAWQTMATTPADNVYAEAGL